MWYGENQSGREEPWRVGDLVRYGDGITALMRITHVYPEEPRPEGRSGIASGIRYSGRAFHSTGTCTSRYHGQCHEPDELDLLTWAGCHNPETDAWNGKYTMPETTA